MNTIDSNPVPATIELAPPDYCDPVIEFYKKDVDRTLLRENLKLTVEERFRKAERIHNEQEEFREAQQSTEVLIVEIPSE
jgi:hypothetical protein